MTRQTRIAIASRPHDLIDRIPSRQPRRHLRQAPDQRHNMTTNIISGFYADDLDVTIDQQGQGRPVLLLHGGGGPPSMGPLPSALSQHFEVIAPVHPGFAGTPRPDWYDGIDDIALSYLDRARRLLLAHARGADRVLVPRPRGRTRPDPAPAASTRRPGRQRRDPRGVRPRAVHARPKATATARARPDASHGDLGRERPDRARALRTRIRRLIPNGRYEPIPNAGHLPHLEQPQQVLQAIHRFADETTRPATTQPG